MYDNTRAACVGVCMTLRILTCICIGLCTRLKKNMLTIYIRFQMNTIV